MKPALFLLLAGTALAASPQGAGGPPARTALKNVEQAFDSRIKGFDPMDPMELFSSTQGVYLGGYGVVFTAQVDLIMTPAITPWRSVISEQDKVKIHARKLARLPSLKARMREVLTMAATALDGVPETENVVLAVSLFHFAWEDRTGLPAQIVMQAPRQKLLSRPVAEDAIRTQEF